MAGRAVWLSEAHDEALVRPKTMHVACITVVLLVALPLIGTLIGAYLYVLLAWAAFLPGEVVNICSRKEEKEGRTGILIALEVLKVPVMAFAYVVFTVLVTISGAN